MRLLRALSLPIAAAMVVLVAAAAMPVDHTVTVDIH